MGRAIRNLSENVTVAFGGDHAIGQFVDVMDSRYAGTPEDEQGEGYVVEWSEMFGLEPNLIGVTLGELKTNPKRVVELCDKFCKDKGYE